MSLLDKILDGIQADQDVVVPRSHSSAGLHWLCSSYACSHLQQVGARTAYSLGLAGVHLYFSAKPHNKAEGGSFRVRFMLGLIVFKKKPETNQI